MNDTQKFKNHADVVVIGGGVAGCSVLYHLTQEGITDAVLVERDSLTSGSTWHAAAQVTQFGGNQTMLALKKHSLQLYQKLAAGKDGGEGNCPRADGGMLTVGV